jgi:predicted dithiol-disulfide oxidoreductase (DUF899 family)
MAALLPSGSQPTQSDHCVPVQHQRLLEGQIWHTYSAYARGTENVVNTYNYLDFVPKSRDEDALPFTMSWVRHHDRSRLNPAHGLALPR